jgi:ribose-phosphate pyrophosphokinase
MIKALTIFSGNANRELAEAICKCVEIRPGAADVLTFSDGEIFVEIGENVRGVNCFVVQPTSAPVNQHLMELLITIDALKRASAGSIIAIIPYFGYARQDRKIKPRTPITAKLVADLLTAAGADRVVTVDLHAGQIQGFFNVPVDELTALYLIRDYFKRKHFENMVVVATDMGISKRARDLAAKLNCPLAIGEKRRLGNTDQTETQNIIGDVRGKIAIILDDEIDTAGSITGVAQAVQNMGAADIYACCTHPIFSGPAVKRLAASPIKEIVVTDTVPLTREKKLDKITVLSVAPMLGEAIRRIHTGMSIGAMFEEE